MSQARGIQYDTVAAVADRLVAAGVKADQISAIMIREETKTGSLTTIVNQPDNHRQSPPPVAGSRNEGGHPGGLQR